MKELKYEAKEGWLKTECPYIKSGDTKVGSLACQECEGFVEDDEDAQIVKCRFDEILKERKSQDNE